MMQMKFKAIHPNFQLPEFKSAGAGAFDLILPESITVHKGSTVMVPLGFSAAVPEGFMAILAPRSGEGAKKAVELSNTVGFIDSDYRGEWVAALSLKPQSPLTRVTYEAGQRVIQCTIVVVARPQFLLVDELPETVRGAGGFGSTGN